VIKKEEEETPNKLHRGKIKGASDLKCRIKHTLTLKVS
jgi:hypothetical protein